MRRARGAWIPVVLLACTLGSGHAAVWHVRPGGTGNKSGANWDNALATVTAGLAKAASGDTVKVATGIYNERITLPSGVRLEGGYFLIPGQPEVWQPTSSVLDGGNRGAVVEVQSGAGSNTVLTGFTIVNGTGHETLLRQSYGGGVYAADASFALQYNVFKENWADVGGAISLHNSQAIIEDNSFEDNSAHVRGGAIACSGGSTTVERSAFRRNRAPAGGAVHAESAVIQCSVFERNRAYTDGSAIYQTGGKILNNTVLKGMGAARGALGLYGPVKAINNIVAENTSGISVAAGASPVIVNNDVFGNTSGNYAGIADKTGTDGNISRDPHLNDPDRGDYDPVPGSPCIDAGMDMVFPFPSKDYNNGARIEGAMVDIGAAEAAMAAARTAIRVKENGDDAKDGGSWANAKRTVQAGINAAVAQNREVWVAAGTYRETVDINKNVMLFGGFAGNESVRYERNPFANVTVLDGTDKDDSVVYLFGTAVTRDTLIDGFAIRNGAGKLDGTTFRGGGIFCDSASPTICGNIVENNDVMDADSSTGGGIYVRAGSPIISCNVIRNNQAEYGGGVCQVSFGSSEPPAIMHNIIEDHVIRDEYSLFGSGAGIYLNITTAEVSRNTIRRNEGGDGGGIYVEASSAKIYSNSFNGNSASDASDIYCKSDALIYGNTFNPRKHYSNIDEHVTLVSGAPTVHSNLFIGDKGSIGLTVRDSSASITNNTFVGYMPGSSYPADEAGIRIQFSKDTTAKLSVTGNIFAYNHFGIAAWFELPGGSTSTNNNCFYMNDQDLNGVPTSASNIRKDPRFVNPDGGDYHLRFDSPCVDAGDDSVVASGARDVNGFPRKTGDHVDIGACEYQFVEGVGIGGVFAALRIAAGMEVSSPVTMQALNVEKTGASASCIDACDAGRILRYEMGLE